MSEILLPSPIANSPTLPQLRTGYLDSTTFSCVIHHQLGLQFSVPKINDATFVPSVSKLIPNHLHSKELHLHTSFLNHSVAGYMVLWQLFLFTFFLPCSIHSLFVLSDLLLLLFVLLLLYHPFVFLFLLFLLMLFLLFSKL